MTDGCNTSKLAHDTDDVVELALRMISLRSSAPAGNTDKMASVIAQTVADVPRISVQRLLTPTRRGGLLLRVEGCRPGKRLVFCGHISVFPVVAPDQWHSNPGGELRGDRLFGSGVADMRGGVAAIVSALCKIAEQTSEFEGEVVAVFVDAERFAGSQNVGQTQESNCELYGDAMISADPGIPHLLRPGDNGLLWLRLTALGTASASCDADACTSSRARLIEALGALQALHSLHASDAQDCPERQWSISTPSDGREQGASIDEIASDYVTFGLISQRGELEHDTNQSETTVEIRIPGSVDPGRVEREVSAVLHEHPNVKGHTFRRYLRKLEKFDNSILDALIQSATVRFAENPSAVQFQVSIPHEFSALIPSVVCGLTPHNAGVPDEYISVAELCALRDTYATAAMRFLCIESSAPDFDG